MRGEVSAGGVAPTLALDVNAQPPGAGGLRAVAAERRLPRRRHCKQDRPLVKAATAVSVYTALFLGRTWGPPLLKVPFVDCYSKSALAHLDGRPKFADGGQDVGAAGAVVARLEVEADGWGRGIKAGDGPCPHLQGGRDVDGAAGSHVQPRPAVAGGTRAGARFGGLWLRLESSLPAALTRPQGLAPLFALLPACPSVPDVSGATRHRPAAPRNQAPQPPPCKQSHISQHTPSCPLRSPRYRATCASAGGHHLVVRTAALAPPLRQHRHLTRELDPPQAIKD